MIFRRVNALRSIACLAAAATAPLFAADPVASGTAAAPSVVPEVARHPDLAGTAWKLVKIVYGDDSTHVPGDPELYTVAFGADGNAAFRIDCNRGRATWKSEGEGRIAFGPVAATRAACPPGSLHDRVLKDLPHFRSYVVERGNLFLSLWADGGTYEFAPRAAAP